MTDPRNVAHDKKVQQEKKHRGEEIAPDSEHAPQPGRKPHLEHHASDHPPEPPPAAQTDDEADEGEKPAA